MRVTLTVVAGPYSGQQFTFDQTDRFLVGRSRRAHFRLKKEGDKDLSVSRRHLLIEVNPPLCRLYDMSRHGTYVNGQRVTTCDLTHRSYIRIGRNLLRVTIEETSAESTVAWQGNVEVSAIPPLPSPPLPVPLSGSAGQVCLCCGQWDLGAGSQSSPPALPGRAVLICTPCQQQARQRPQDIPGYLLLKELGRGAMGVVYLGLRQADLAVLAVKTILPSGKPSGSELARFLREANILRELEHRRIVSFREVGNAGKLLYFAMDYIIGTDASNFLKRRGPLSIPWALRIVMQVLKGLEYAHDKGFVHRDIKPANVLLQQVGSKLAVKVSDFGLARIYQASQLSGLTMENEMGGTLGFMPPEQITDFRNVSPTADQYAAAAMLYNLLTGRYVLDLRGPVPAQVDQILSKTHVPIRTRRPEIPKDLAAVIHRALRRKPERRFRDVRAFWGALRPFA